MAELLDLLAALAPFADEEEGPLSGVVFKVEHSPALGRVAHVRLFSGELKNRDAVKCSPSGAEGKVTQIREVQGAKERDTGLLRAGEAGALCGVPRIVCGDTFGDPSRVPPPAEMSAPLLRVRLTPPTEAGYPALVAALEELSAEDPASRRDMGEGGARASRARDGADAYRGRCSSRCANVTASPRRRASRW